MKGTGKYRYYSPTSGGIDLDMHWDAKMLVDKNYNNNVSQGSLCSLVIIYMSSNKEVSTSL